MNTDPLNKITTQEVGYFICPRCNNKHTNIQFHPIRNPSDGLFVHWALCPSEQSPILLYWDGSVARIK